MRVLVIATLLLAACGKDDAPGLRLLNAGAGDKHLLRYSPTKGTTYGLVMTMEMDLGMGLDPPATSVTMEITVTDVTPEGDISYDFRFTDLDMEGAPLPPEAEKMMDMTGSAVMDSRGVSKAGKFNVPDDAPAALKQMVSKFEEQLNQLSCPFPEDAVGIGAKWTLTQDIDTPAFGLRQVATFELVELKGNRGKLKFSLKQSAEDQEMKGLPGGAKATLLSLDSSGGGELEFDLSKPFPVKSFIDISSDIRVKVKDQTQRQQIGIKITFKEK